MMISQTVPTSSETSGPASLANAASSAIGQLRSGMLSVNASPAAALAKLTPQETNARVAIALERISGRQPSFGRRMMFPENGPAYSICETASWRCSTDEQRSQALEAIEFALRPAPEGEIAAALYTLRTMTRGREAGSDNDRQAEAILWIQHLSAYPADIVLSTLRNWPKRPDGQWWPTWHDVQKVLDGLASERKLLAQHVRGGKCLPAPAAQEDRDDSPEGVARRQAFVASRRASTFPRPDPAPVSVIEDFEAWEKRTKEDLSRSSLKLSPEALQIIASKPRMTDAEYQEFMEGKAEQSA